MWDEKIKFCDLEAEFKRHFQSEDVKEFLQFLQKKLVCLFDNVKTEAESKSFNARFSKDLPVIRTVLDQKEGKFLTITLLCESDERHSIEKYIFDLFSYHLMPGKIIFPSSFHHLTFLPSKQYHKPLYLVHLAYMIKNERDYDFIEHNLPFIVKALKRGLQNHEYAKAVNNNQIGISDQKGSHIHDKILRVIKRWPEFSDCFLQELSMFMPFSSEVFRQHRSSKHLARIICSLALLRKLARESRGIAMKRPRIHFRLFPMNLQFMFGDKETVGLCIGISRLNDYQLLNEGSILQAIRGFSTDIQTVKGSFFSYQHPQDSTLAIYIEFEKKKGEPFTLEEKKKLKKHLSRNLDASIEDVVPSVVRMNNEEEIMKSIIFLRNELQSIDDLAQVMISFEGQSLTHLTFIVTLVRILEQNNTPVSEKFATLEDGWEFIPERTRIVSLSNDEITKEANVFRLRLKKSRAFVRTDSSVNLHLARQFVVDYLMKKVGPIRDFTGSLIFLQNSHFAQFKEKFSDVDDRYPNIIEEFFYTLSPADIQIVLPFLALETLFKLFLGLIDDLNSTSEKNLIKKSETEDYAFAVLRLNSSLFERLDKKIKADKTLPNSLISNAVHFQDYIYLGYIYQAQSTHDRALFFQQLQSALLSSIEEEQGLQELSLAADRFPTSFDPRTTLYPTTNYIFKLLFDGLMRLDATGERVCAVADSYTLSEDRKTYTFDLRESYWNNKDPVTAHDFVYSWKKLLSPSFNTSFAYLFYSIKNALAAKKGEVSLDMVGVYAKDAHTLVVELEYPVAHFLQYLTLNLFYPVNSKIEQLHPDWPFRTQEEYVCNGPFTLEKSIHNHELELVKNTHYWDSKRVRLSKVNIGFCMSHSMILKQFESQDIHWFGPPFIRWKNQFSEQKESKQMGFTSSLSWINVNTQTGPFRNKKLRQAFMHALHTEEFAECFPQDAQPAYTPLPEFYSTYERKSPKGNKEQAKVLFEEALQEMNLTAKELPKLTVCQAIEAEQMRGNLLTKIQAHIKHVLGIDIFVETIPWQQASQKMITGNFQLFVLGWRFLCNTPCYLLDIFNSQERHKFYHWSNQRYIEALREIRQEENPNKRQEKIALAERILIEEVPVIPLYSEREHYIMSDRLKGVVTDNRFTAVDLKNAYLKSVKTDPYQILQWM